MTKRDRFLKQGRQRTNRVLTELRAIAKLATTGEYTEGEVDSMCGAITGELSITRAAFELDEAAEFDFHDEASE